VRQKVGDNGDDGVDVYLGGGDDYWADDFDDSDDVDDDSDDDDDA